MTQRGLNAYRQTEVQSRTPVELVVMLYDGALRHLSAAKSAIARHDIPARRDAIGRVLAIVSELQSTLDVERGGTIADTLDGLYGYMTRRIMDAAMSNDAAPLSEVERLVATVREGWQGVATPPAHSAANGSTGAQHEPVQRMP